MKAHVPMRGRIVIRRVVGMCYCANFSIALVSVSTAISFAFHRARRDGRAPRVADDIPHTETDRRRKTSALTATRHDPFEIRGFEPICLPLARARARNKTNPHHSESRIAFSRRTYTSRLVMSARIYLLTSSASLLLAIFSLSLSISLSCPSFSASLFRGGNKLTRWQDEFIDIIIKK